LKAKAMKKLIILALLFGFVSCAKIKENRLTGAWTMSKWELTDDAGNSYDGLAEFDDMIGGEVRLEFLGDGRVLLQDYNENDLVSEEEGRWETDESVDHLSFPDSIWLFNQGASYNINQLRRGELELSGPFNTGRRNYTASNLTFVTR
jgi:hypothetical protein